MQRKNLIPFNANKAELTDHKWPHTKYRFKKLIGLNYIICLETVPLMYRLWKVSEHDDGGKYFVHDLLSYCPVKSSLQVDV